MLHGIFSKGKNLKSNANFDIIDFNALSQNYLTWQSTHCWLAQSHHKDHQPIKTVETNPSLKIIAWARLDNYAELIEKLNLKQQSHNYWPDQTLILLTYQQFGEDCVKHLFGDFCFAIYDQDQHKIFCARDHMGVKPFYYYLDDHIFIFSTSLTIFHQLPYLKPQPKMSWMAKYLLANDHHDFEQTPYQHILKLPPAYQLTITNKQQNKKRYFSFHTEKIYLKQSTDYVEMYQQQLEQAIKSRLTSDHPFGFENSGGIDSSTVTAYSAKFYDKPLDNLFTFSFANLMQEPKYIALLNSKTKIPNSYTYYGRTEKSLYETQFLENFGLPVEHDIAAAHGIFYQIAQKHNIRTLFSGFGGDEFVTTIHGDLYLYELLSNQKYLTLYQQLPGNLLTKWLRLARLYKNSTANGGKINHNARKVSQARWPYQVLKASIIEDYGLKASYDKIANFDHGYNNLDQFTLENRWAPFVTTRLENCTLMASLYGIEYRWPLLDPRLIQCFLSIPSSEKYHKGMGRYLHRRAIENVVPKEITWKKGKYMGEKIHKSNQFFDNLKLNEDLHPDLHLFIDIQKLKQQASLQATDRHTPLGYRRVVNIHRTNLLDQWLKYYFKNGANWSHC